MACQQCEEGHSPVTLRRAAAYAPLSLGWRAFGSIDMKFANVVAMSILAAGLVLSDDSFALGSAIVVAPSGPAAEADGASSAVRSGMSSDDNARKEGARATGSHSAHRSASNAASSPAGTMQHAPQ